MSLLEYDRRYNWFGYVSNDMGEPTDYWDFPSTMYAFAESLTNSRLASWGVSAYFRLRGDQLTLITYFCNSIKLRTILEALKISGYKIKSLNYANKDMSAFKRTSYGREWWVDNTWSVEQVLAGHSSKTAWHLRKAVERGPSRYETCYDMNLDETMGLFRQWVVEARQRHFMVVQGHYISYIQRYYESNDNVRLIGLRRKADGKLMGVMSYELWRGMAQVTLCKLLVDDTFKEFCKYAWIVLVMSMLNENVQKAFCGSTADTLKEYLGMQCSRSYKLF